MATIRKIIPNLWFDRQAEDAAKFYVSVFPNSGIGKVTRYGKSGTEIHGMPEGMVMTVDFKLAGQDFMGLNGGPYFKFTEAVSFVVLCSDQEEIDQYWEKLKAGGDEKAQQCGWLKDKFGLSWQIVPETMEKLMTEGTQEQADRVMTAMLQMKKIDMAALQAAFDK